MTQTLRLPNLRQLTHGKAVQHTTKQHTRMSRFIHKRMRRGIKNDKITPRTTSSTQTRRNRKMLCQLRFIIERGPNHIRLQIDAGS
jgi:hypothetical protein